jgi:hypothetical protein
MKRRLLVLAFAVAALPQAPLRSAICTVTRTEDSGTGTLRQAILDANARSGPDTIVFHIPLSDPGLDLSTGTWNIRPRSELPEVLDRGTRIDGASQSAFIGSDSNPLGPEIVLDGGSAGNASGVVLAGSGHALRNLAVQRFRYRQVYVTGDSNAVAGCFLGCDATGTVSMGVSDGGLLIEDGHGNVIGGPAASDRNVIGGNSDNGVEITYLSSGNRVEGNFIGVRQDGSAALANGKGVALTNGARSNVIGPGNVISGNRQNGIVLMGTGTSSNVVAGNLIGPAPGGTRSIGNGDDGLLLFGVSRNRVGGSSEADRNVVSGNLYSGIALRGERCDSNEVAGNFIGLDATGVFTMSNGENGVTVALGPKDNRIGGVEEGGGNVIGGNLGNGIQIHGLGTAGNLVLGNRIGTGRNGSVPAPNFLEGVSVTAGATRNRIGPLNVIAFNSGNGVSVTKAGTTANTIYWNSIHDNARRGIRTAEGGNRDLAPPVLISANPVTGIAAAGGRVEIYSDSSGEGRVFEAAVTADASGNFTWSGMPAGPNVTATVTDAEGNTSAFSDPLDAADVEDGPAGTPVRCRLSAAFPNPFNASTVVRFGAPAACRVRLDVFDGQGRRVRTLADGVRPAGEWTVRFDASGLPSGAYVVRMEAGGFTASRKIALVK